MAIPNFDINRLNRDQRLELIEELWDSLSASPDGLPLTEAQRAELDWRVDEMNQDDSLGMPSDEVMKQIRSRA
jgi:putative addiction module component (TIGR02574 family)